MKKIADPSKMGSAADDKVSHNMKNTLRSAYITCRALTTYLRLTQSREEGSSPPSGRSNGILQAFGHHVKGWRVMKSDMEYRETVRHRLTVKQTNDGGPTVKIPPSPA